MSRCSRGIPGHDAYNDGSAQCYRLGYEREKIRADATEKERAAATAAMLAATCGPVERAEWEALVTKARNERIAAEIRADAATKALLDYAERNAATSAGGLTDAELNMTPDEWAEAFAEDPSCMRAYLEAAIQRGREEGRGAATQARTSVAHAGWCDRLTLPPAIRDGVCQRCSPVFDGNATAQPAPSASDLLSGALTGKEGLGAAAQAENLLGKLVAAMRTWGQWEDGIPDEFFAAWLEARALVSGEPRRAPDSPSVAADGWRCVCGWSSAHRIDRCAKCGRTEGVARASVAASPAGPKDLERAPSARLAHYEAQADVEFACFCGRGFSSIDALNNHIDKWNADAQRTPSSSDLVGSAVPATQMGAAAPRTDPFKTELRSIIASLHEEEIAVGVAASELPGAFGPHQYSDHTHRLAMASRAFGRLARRLRVLLDSVDRAAPAAPPVLPVDPAADERIEQLRASQPPETTRAAVPALPSGARQDLRFTPEEKAAIERFIEDQREHPNGMGCGNIATQHIPPRAASAASPDDLRWFHDALGVVADMANTCKLCGDWFYTPEGSIPRGCLDCAPIRHFLPPWERVVWLRRPGGLRGVHPAHSPFGNARVSAPPSPSGALAGSEELTTKEKK